MEDYQIISYQPRLFGLLGYKINIYGMYTVEEAFYERYNVLKDLRRGGIVEVVRLVDDTKQSLEP